jgi:hypothetical protein
VPPPGGGGGDTHSGEGEWDADCEAGPSQVIGCSVVSHHSSEMWIIVNQLVKSQLHIHGMDEPRICVGVLVD